MHRLHLFELEDQPWFPALIRDAGSAYLELVSRLAGHAKAIAPVLARALQRSGEDRIVDLCSGGGGPLPTALSIIDRQQGRTLSATLTDLYPSRDAFERMTRNHPAVTAEFGSIDATSVPSNLKGLRTIFNGCIISDLRKPRPSSPAQSRIAYPLPSSRSWRDTHLRYSACYSCHLELS